jgi:hypothetical protein
MIDRPTMYSVYMYVLYNASVNLALTGPDGTFF